MKSKFALYNENIFLQKLRAGDIKKELSKSKRQEIRTVVHEYKTSNEIRLQSSKTVNSLTVEVLELHNKKMEEQGADFDNESDEEPLGRGIVRDHSRKHEATSSKTEETNTQFEEPKPKLNNAESVSTAKSTEELLPKRPSSIYIRKLMIAKYQKRESPKQDTMQNLSLDTKSSVDSERYTFTQYKIDKEAKKSHKINTEDKSNTSDKIFSDKKLSFRQDNKTRQPTSGGAEFSGRKPETGNAKKVLQKCKYTV